MQNFLQWTNFFSTIFSLVGQSRFGTATEEHLIDGHDRRGITGFTIPEAEPCIKWGLSVSSLCLWTNMGMRVAQWW